MLQAQAPRTQGYEENHRIYVSSIAESKILSRSGPDSSFLTGSRKVSPTNTKPVEGTAGTLSTQKERV